jgi:hypothetical protein
MAFDDSFDAAKIPTAARRYLHILPLIPVGSASSAGHRLRSQSA